MPWTTSADRVKAMLAYVPPVERVAFPAPLRASNETGGTPEYPSGVLKLQRDAEGAGWATERTYALGFLPHATHGRPSPEAKHSFALRMTRAGDRAVAIHMAGAWTFFRRSSRMFQPYASLADFTDDIAGRMVDRPSGAEWAKMLINRPLKPTKRQWDEMDAAWERYYLRPRGGTREQG